MLCLGDSNTYTGGGNSYPDQLAKRLSDGGVAIKVVNRGVPGMNSTQLADAIEGELDLWKPDAAIVLIGADNFWNNLPVRQETLLYRTDRALLSLRSWRLVKLMMVGITEGTLRGHYRKGRGRDDALSRVEDALSRSMEHPDDWYRVQLNELPEAPGVEAAARTLAAAVKAEPRDHWARTVLGRWLLSRGDAAAAAEVFREGAAQRDCISEFYSGLAKSLERLEGERAAAAVFKGGGGRCVPEKRVAEAEWRLWRGEPEVAARLARASLGDGSVRGDGWRVLGWALYDLKDYDGAIAAFMEHEKRVPKGSGPGLEQAWARKWEDRLAKHPQTPPPPQAGGETAGSWYLAGQYERCAEAAGRALAAEPLDISGFHLYALCMKRAGRFDDARKLADEIPALKGNLMYRYYEAQVLRRRQLDRPLEELQAEQFGRDMERVALAARRRGVSLVFSSYPEEEYEPVRRVAKEWGLPYVDLVALFRTRFKHRDEFLAGDRCHPNARGFAVMAEAYERVLRPLPGFPAGEARP